MESIRNKIKELESAIANEDIHDIINEVEQIKENTLLLLDDIESIVNDAESAIKDINKSIFVDLDDIEQQIKEASKSLY